jgi:hypothetical protein
LPCTKTLALAAAAAAALACAPPAFSQPAPGQAVSGQAWPDGSLSPAEGYGPHRGGGRGFGRPVTLADYQARFRDRILQADTDHDGRVSLAEWTAYRAARGGDEEGGHEGGRGFGDPTRQFQMMDANRDGYVTASEIDAVSAERFARLDANHDGVVSPDERRALRGGATGGGEPAQPLPPPQ